MSDKLIIAIGAAKEGAKWTVHDRGYIASNGLLHDEVVRIVNK